MNGPEWIRVSSSLKSAALKCPHLTFTDATIHISVIGISVGILVLVIRTWNSRAARLCGGRFHFRITQIAAADLIAIIINTTARATDAFDFPDLDARSTGNGTL